MGERRTDGTPVGAFGPIDYLVLEFPGTALAFSHEMVHVLEALIEAGTIRLLDLLVLRKDRDGTVEAFEVGELDTPGTLRRLESQMAEILAAEDVVHLAAAMELDSIAGVLVWENAWAAPFVSATRRAGGQLVATGPIPIRAIAASMEAQAATSNGGP